MSTDNNIPPQFMAVKDNDEEILWVGRPSFIPFLATGLPFLCVGLIWGAIDYFGFIQNVRLDNPGFTIPFFALHLFPFWGSILNMVRLTLTHGNTCYAITNKRLMMRSGFLGTDFKGIDYDKLTNVEVNVNPLENMYGVGSIKAFSGGVNNDGRSIFNRFVAVSSPYEVFKKIKEVSVDVKTDWNYPNALRPPENTGYKTKYNPE